VNWLTTFIIDREGILRIEARSKEGLDRTGAVAALSHPDILAIHDCGTEGAVT
jgi:hypothetical protein